VRLGNARFAQQVSILSGIGVQGSCSRCPQPAVGTWVSTAHPLGSIGRSGRSVSLELIISMVLGRPSRRKNEPLHTNHLIVSGEIDVNSVWKNVPPGWPDPLPGLMSFIYIPRLDEICDRVLMVADALIKAQLFAAGQKIELSFVARKGI